MFNIKDVRITNEQNHLFIPANKTNEVLWVLERSGADMSDIVVKQWRKVLKHQIPAIKHITDTARDAEIVAMYGEFAKYVQAAPAVILSHYNVNDLFDALHESLIGEGDIDYIAYFDERQSRLRNEEDVDAIGIQVITKDE